MSSNHISGFLHRLFGSRTDVKLRSEALSESQRRDRLRVETLLDELEKAKQARRKQRSPKR